jgi:hypothetical protein
LTLGKNAVTTDHLADEVALGLRFARFGGSVVALARKMGLTDLLDIASPRR